MSDLEYLSHYGIKDMHWGDRRFQNPDGSLTPLGRVRYGVGAARKKATDTVGRVVKSTARSLAKDRREAVQARQKRRAQDKQERAEAKQARIQARNERIDKLFNDKKTADNVQKIESEASKKSMSEIITELANMRLDAKRKRVERLEAKQERVRQNAELTEREKYLKKSMNSVKRTAAKDARKKYSSKDIKNLSDEELNARISRLRNEATLRSLETERAAPTVSAGAKMVGEWTKAGVGAAAKQLIGTKALSYGKKAMGLTEEEIDEFYKLTKKK